MPFNLSFTHIFVVAIVALVVLGPEKLPEAARTAGKLYREWRRISTDLQSEVRDVFSEYTEPFKEVVSDIRTGNVGPPAAGQPLPDLAPAIPALGPSSGLVTPGPSLTIEIPPLGGEVDPATFQKGSEQSP